MSPDPRYSPVRVLHHGSEPLPGPASRGLDPMCVTARFPSCRAPCDGVATPTSPTAPCLTASVRDDWRHRIGGWHQGRPLTVMSQLILACRGIPQGLP